MAFPIRALVGDAAQRLLTLNKLEQRRAVFDLARQLRPAPGARVLDFGCGTGLFATTLQAAGFEYHGFDPDAGSIRYARMLYPQLSFASRLDEAAAAAPYAAVIANCCFHHISDDDLRRDTLPAIARLLRPDGHFLLIDVLPMERHASLVRQAFNRLELGDNKRTGDQLDRLLTGQFVVATRSIRRFFALSAPSALNPIYNDLILYSLTRA